MAEPVDLAALYAAAGPRSDDVVRQAADEIADLRAALGLARQRGTRLRRHLEALLGEGCLPARRAITLRAVLERDTQREGTARHG